MRYSLLIPPLLALSACIEPTVSKIDYRTYRIESGGIPGGSSAPNRRIAQQVCPSGYRVMDESTHQNTPDRARDDIGNIYTTWTVRCL